MIHGWWLPRQGINGFTGEPKEKYYALRGWKADLVRRMPDSHRRASSSPSRTPAPTARSSTTSAELAKLTGAELLLVHVADGWAARNFDQLKLRESEEMKADRSYLEQLRVDLAGRA